MTSAFWGKLCTFVGGVISSASGFFTSTPKTTTTVSTLSDPGNLSSILGSSVGGAILGGIPQAVGAAAGALGEVAKVVNQEITVRNTPEMIMAEKSKLEQAQREKDIEAAAKALKGDLNELRERSSI